MKWITLADKEAVANTACEAILASASAAIRKEGRFTLVLAGGSTPALTYQKLAQSNTDFSNWHFFIGDERCLSVESADRNSQMILEQLITPGKISSAQFHPIPAELGAELAAEQYAAEIEAFLPFDCILLGLGEDGHTASLFPGHQHPKNQKVVPVHDAPKPPPDRVSLNNPIITQAEQVFFIISGENKKPVIEKWQNQEDFPARLIAEQSNTTIFIEEKAMP